jgi:hypothetical protein
LVERLANSIIAMGAGLFRLSGKALIECITLLRCEPFDVLRPVREELEGDDPEQHGEGALDDEEPTPASTPK